MNIENTQRPLNIVVTGGAGFIGSHVAEAYRDAGHRVWVLDDFSTGKMRNIPDGVGCIRMSLNAPPPLLRTALQRVRPDIINHHAAQISVSESVRRPERDAEINIMGLLSLLKAADALEISRFVFASSGGTVYGEPDEMPLAETAPINPISPYGIAKAASEFYIRSFAARCGFNYSFVRYSNVFGPRQDPHGEAGVVAIFVKRLLARRRCVINGDGKYIRDYVFVRDVARANFLATMITGDLAVNIGTGVPTDVNQLYAALRKVTGVDLEPEYGPARPGDLRENLLDNTLAGQLLGWSPRFSLEQGLAETHRYFSELS